MIFQLSKEKVQHFEFHFFDEMIERDGNELEGKLTAEGLRISGCIRRENRQKILLSLTATGTMLYPCARCLEYVPTDVAYQYEETVDLPEDADAVNLVPYVEECLFINEPFKVLCDEGCRGICPGCGVNLNREACRCEGTEMIDPRLEALKQLL